MILYEMTPELLDQLRQSIPHIPLAVGFGMFIGWLIGYVRGHKAGLRERSARMIEVSRAARNHG